MSKTLSAEAEHKPYFTTKRMALIGVMTAVTCILGPFSIPLPFSPVPISFTNLAIYLAAYVLGMKACTVSYLIYMLLGMVGVPVFSGFTAGVGFRRTAARGAHQRQPRHPQPAAHPDPRRRAHRLLYA